jgi:hypothetical protein
VGGQVSKGSAERSRSGDIKLIRAGRSIAGLKINCPGTVAGVIPGTATVSGKWRLRAQPPEAVETATGALAATRKGGRPGRLRREAHGAGDRSASQELGPSGEFES